MPPRIPLTVASPASSKPLQRSQPSPISTRSFSQSCPQQLRRLARWRRSKLNTIEMKDYLQWATTEGTKYKVASEQPNYLQLARGARGGRDGNKDTRGAAADAAKEQEDADELQDDVGNANARRKEGTKVRPKSNIYTPFPLNPYFKSQPVLSEGSREAIYDAVVVRKKSVRETSTLFKVSMERVAAVVRMKQMERDWLEEGKKVVPFFSQKVLKMLPQTSFSPNSKIEHHESVNDLPVHSATAQQIFWPTSESREFTRIDAGRVFQSGLLPADMRIPHPEQVDVQAAAMNMTRSMAMERMREALEKKLNDEEEERQAQLAKQESMHVVAKKRWDFRIEDVNIETIGQNEKSRHGIGYRYGMPHNDRKRGLIKIPTSVS